MMTMNELVDLRMQQHIAHEIYRQQIIQRIPDPFPHMLPIAMPRHVIMPPRITLPGVEVTLQNDELWKQFHQIGTEMIITKCGRRMFPSMRLSLGGLEDESNYCVLLEMVPIGDCRYKFSGSQWVPAGGAEPQSPQRMYLHPDSPASGSHWQAQPILFNKVKLTNNTLDSNGHIVLASMHKYQPRIHVIRTADLTQIPWAPQQAFVFPETEFVAVTAYQNDRITKLKIDNNPFAKGFRETGQSRSKRKMSSSPSDEDQEQRQTQLQQQQQTHLRQQPQPKQSPHSHSQWRSGLVSPSRSVLAATSESGSSICSDKPSRPQDNDTDNPNENENDNLNANHHQHDNNHRHIDDYDGSSDDNVDVDGDIIGGTAASAAGAVNATVERRQIKRIRSEDTAPLHLIASPSSAQDEFNEANVITNYGSNRAAAHGHPLATEEASLPALPAPLHDWPTQIATPEVATHAGGASTAFVQHFQQNMQSLLRPSLVDLACTYFGRSPPIYATHLYAPHATLEALPLPLPLQEQLPMLQHHLPPLECAALPTRACNAEVNDDDEPQQALEIEATTPRLSQSLRNPTQPPSPTKRKGFSISAILGSGGS